MLRFTCFALLLTLSCGLELKASIDKQWETFKSVYNKKYNPEEESKRMEIFRSQVKAVLKHNLNADFKLSHYKLGINEFSDQGDEEFEKTMLGVRLDPLYHTAHNFVRVSLPKAPAAQDWTEHMGPVESQGSCGGCWAFATTAAIQGHYSIYKGRKVNLSEQNLLDCSGNNGCKNGLPTRAMQYVIKNGGISSDICYPYEKKDGACRYNASCNSAQISSFVVLPSGDENALLEAVGNVGPVTVLIDAPSDLKSYSSGVYFNPKCSRTTPNHAVVVVGYGTEDNEPFWLIRNSWGSRFGLDGHFKLKRGVKACVITLLPSYPVI